MVNIEAIREMMRERVNDLLDLIEGESKYCGDSVDNLPKTEEEKVFRGMALDHVRFVVKFGVKKQKVIEGEKVYSSRLDGFERWLAMGAPGIVPSELNEYLNDHPF